MDIDNQVFMKNNSVNYICPVHNTQHPILPLIRVIYQYYIKYADMMEILRYKEYEYCVKQRKTQKFNERYV